jgi:hypothetical protein
MSTFELRGTQSREFTAAVRYLDANTCAELSDVVTNLVRCCPTLGYEYLSILLSDWALHFRVESQGEIDAMLLRALEARAA